MSEQDIIDAAVDHFINGGTITDLQARVIASAWNGGASSPLASLATTGAITEYTMRELQTDVMHPSRTRAERAELNALADYCTHHPRRGPVTGWADLNW